MKEGQKLIDHDGTNPQHSVSDLYDLDNRKLTSTLPLRYVAIDGCFPVLVY